MTNGAVGTRRAAGSPERGPRGRHDAALKPLVVLVTRNYPHRGNGGEVMFVAPEVERLARERAFELWVAPVDDDGPALAVPAGVTVQHDLSRALRDGYDSAKAVAWTWPGFVREGWRALRHGGHTGQVLVWRWAAQAGIAWRWARASVPAGRPALFYTYWRMAPTLGLARFAQRRPRTAVITRVHGHDLYEHRLWPPFQPWRSVYDALDAVVPISAHGRDHLLASGVDGRRIALHRLGVDDVGRPEGERRRVTRPSADGVARIVSCSMAIPLKRVPRSAAAVVELARRHPALRFAWTHFGDGADMQAVREALAGAPGNLEVRLRGEVDNLTVRAHYARTPVDAFLMLSASEGLPVSIQEALAAGVPVVATAVGGVPEAVGIDNGVLLGADPPRDEVVAALEQVLLEASPGVVMARRLASRLRWERDFDAERNHAAFAAAVRTRVEAL